MLRTKLVMATALLATAACRVEDANRDGGAQLQQLLQLVEREYVRDVPTDRLVAAARDAMLASLDPYATYFDPAAFAEWNTTIAGSFGGIGIRLDRDAARGVYFARGPLLGSPALAAGVRAGDVIDAVDGHAVAGATMDDVLARLRGEAGREVELGIRRGGDAITLRIVRGDVPIATVRGWSRDEAGRAQHRVPGSDVAYVRLRYFGPTTAAEVERALATATAEGARAIVIDLRHGPGGLLRSAIDIADLFLDQGTIVALHRRGMRIDEVMAKPGVATTLPLALLVDRETKSACEVLAACLQDHGRALVVGERSFGKGSVQKLFPVAGGGAIRLTVEHYLPPSGRPIERHFPGSDPNAGGVSPDDGLTVAMPAEDVTRIGAALLREDDDIGLVGVPFAPRLEGDPALAKACEALAGRALRDR